MNKIVAKERNVNSGEVCPFVCSFAAKFVQKLGEEEALEQSINLPRREGKYKVGRMLVSLLYALVLELERLSDGTRIQADRLFHP